MTKFPAKGAKNAIAKGSKTRLARFYVPSSHQPTLPERKPRSGPGKGISARLSFWHEILPQTPRSAFGTIPATRGRIRAFLIPNAAFAPRIETNWRANE